MSSARKRSKDALVAVGASVGGLDALGILLRALPASFEQSVVMVQHRRADGGSRLLELLAKDSALPLSEPEDKDVIKPGHAYLAPADYHLLVEPGVFSLSIDPPVCFARPSIDVLFESVAVAYGARATAVVLTSASADGAAGAAAIKAAGGRVVVQHPRNAQNPTAVLATLERVEVDGVLELQDIASWLARA